MAATVTFTQFSDIHVAPPGEIGYGGLGYDTGETWAAAHAHAYGSGSTCDFSVITGDIADHGTAEEYEIAAQRLGQIPHPAYLLPGNHDAHDLFHARLTRPGLHTDRSLLVGTWLFLFVDSNNDGRRQRADGRLVDTDDRMHSNGTLGQAETAWIGDMIEAVEADNVWLWVHHTPGAKGLFNNDAYTAEVAAVLDRHPEIKGIGAGHTHQPVVGELAGRPVYTAPALALSFDPEALTTLPPGYRTYTFTSDGTVTSELHLIDDPRWPRRDLPGPVVGLLNGELTWDEANAEMQATFGISFG